MHITRGEHVEKELDLLITRRDGLLITWIDAGAVELDGEKVRLTPDWLERVDDVRRLGGEIDTVDAAGRVDAGADTIAARELEIRRRQYRAWREERARRRARPRPEADGTISELRPARDDAPAQEPAPVSTLAAAVRDFLDRDPQAARQPPGWIGLTLWSHELHPGKPTAGEVRAALEELGGAAYLEEVLSQTRGVA